LVTVEEDLCRVGFTGAVKTLTMDSKDLDSKTSRPWSLIRLEEHRLVRVPSGYIVNSICFSEDTLTEVRREARQDGQLSHHDALRLDVRSSQCMTMLIGLSNDMHQSGQRSNGPDQSCVSASSA
jgi:hypothetical protein